MEGKMVYMVIQISFERDYVLQIANVPNSIGKDDSFILVKDLLSIYSYQKGN